MNYYFAIVHKSPDSAFGIEFPDLPGCFSGADHMREVLPNAIEGLEFWMEDQTDIPQARSLEAITRDAADQLAEGAFIIAVPYIRNTGKVTRINVSLDMGMLAAIDGAADERKLTRSAFLAEAARNEIEGRH